MSPRKPYKFKELVKTLRDYDKKFEVYEERGKGSHRMIYHPDILGRPVSFPVVCHGEGDEIHKKRIQEIVRAFNLPPKLL